MVQLCIMKLASNAETPSIPGKVKQKIIDIGAVTHVFLLFGTYICDGRWVALPSSWCPGVCARALEMGWGVAPTCQRASFKHISWLEIMGSKSEMIKSRFAIVIS